MKCLHKKISNCSIDEYCLLFTYINVILFKGDDEEVISYLHFSHYPRSKNQDWQEKSYCIGLNSNDSGLNPI